MSGRVDVVVQIDRHVGMLNHRAGVLVRPKIKSSTMLRSSGVFVYFHLFLRKTSSVSLWYSIHNLIFSEQQSKM